MCRATLRVLLPGRLVPTIRVIMREPSPPEAGLASSPSPRREDGAALNGAGCSEIRRSKPEGRKKAEVRSPKPPPHRVKLEPTRVSGSRISGLGFLSGFGFRPSDLNPPRPLLQGRLAVCL